MTSPYKILQIAVAVSGVAFLLIYPLAVVWPSGWAWESGAPYQSHLFMMIVAVYATLGIFLLNAARDPQANLSLIWFAAISSVVHSALMAVVGVVLAVLVVASGLKQPSTDRARLLTNKDVASPA